MRLATLISAAAILAATISAPALTGCAALANLAGVPPTVQNTVKLDTGKALDLAYGGLDFVAVGLVEPAVVDGSIKGANAAKIAALLRQARGVLDTTFNAYHSGIASDPTAAINSVLGMIADAKAILNAAGVATPAMAPAAYRTPAAVRSDLDRVLTELRSA